MNKFVKAILDLDFDSIEETLDGELKWLNWCEKSGKNALHYLCGVDISKRPAEAEISLKILELLLKKGLNINSVHKISEKCGFFPATPLWYAYTRGRNKRVFTYLLENGADPGNCMFAIAWYDDVESAGLFKQYGATIKDSAGRDTTFLAAFAWKKFAMAEWFLKNGADVNFADDKGNTALFYALALKKKYGPEDIKLLLKYGADPEKPNNEGLTPKVMAEKNRRREILSLFEIQSKTGVVN